MTVLPSLPCASSVRPKRTADIVRIGKEPRTNIDVQWMADLRPLVDARPKRFRAGLACQYWRNKFGKERWPVEHMA